MEETVSDQDSKANVLERLCRVGQELSSSTDQDELLAKIINCSKEVCNSERASMLLLDEEKNEIYFKQTAGELGEVIRKIRLPLNENSIAGWCILHREPLIILDVNKDPRHYKGVDKATSFETRSILAVPVKWGEKVFGCVEAVNKIGDIPFSGEDQEYLTILAQQAAVALNNVFLRNQLQNFFVHVVEILVSALESIERSGRGHTFRIARLAAAVAREWGMSGKNMENLLYAAYFHDIGRLRPGILGRHDVDFLHPQEGANLLQRIKILEKAVAAVKHHHEYYDGSGFPDGISGDAIPLAARILSMVEDYDNQLQEWDRSKSREDFNKLFLQLSMDRHDPLLLEVFGIVLEKNPARD
ncbi:MAG: HD domain-containing phosphohydrolase [bacterium]